MPLYEINEQKRTKNVQPSQYTIKHDTDFMTAFSTKSDDTSILTETLVQHFVTHWIWANEIYRTFYTPTMYSTCMTFQKKKIFSIENFPLWSIELNGADDVWAYWTTYAVCDCIARNGRKKLVCISLSIESLCLILILDFRVRYG